MKTDLGLLDSFVRQRMLWHAQNNTVNRLFDHDITLWNGSGDPHEEIGNRLGWLDLPMESEALIPELDELAAQLFQEGYMTAILLGMGGSSLAPYVINRTLGGYSLIRKNALRLLVLDSTSPDKIQSYFPKIDLQKTVFIVSSKSGTTSETKALSDYYWEVLLQAGIRNPGRHFIAITDPGSILIEEANRKHFRAVFLANPDVGGRFSALSVFGLLPARLAGADLRSFLKAARDARDQCSPGTLLAENPGLFLGTLLAEAAAHEIDKVSIIADPQLTNFGVWAEQLIAESSGKAGKGIIPVSQEPVLFPDNYSYDRLFIHLRCFGTHDPLINALTERGHPCLTLDNPRFEDLASLFYIWEVAAAITCSLSGVNAFDQPNVQETKTLTKQKIEQLRRFGKIDQPKANYSDSTLEIRWNKAPDLDYDNAGMVFDHFLKLIRPGDYLAINAYLPENPETVSLLQKFRRGFANRYKMATTLGFGPRYLHSTGQLHKGGKNNGIFLVLTQDSSLELEVPGEQITFNQFILAQAAGDIEALISRDRRVLHIHFKDVSKLPILLTLD